MKNLLLYLLLVLCASCSKDDDMSKQEVVRCKVNGEDWEAYDYRDSGSWGVGTGAMDLQYYKDSRFFELSAGKVLEDESVHQAIHFIGNGVLNGTNLIPFFTECFYDANKNSGCKYYHLDTNNQIRHLEIIEIDTLNRWIEGEFEFTAIDRNCNDTVRITNGYFNLLYRF